MALTFRMPDSHSHVRLAWKITAAGVEDTNPVEIPAVIKTRWIFIVCKQGSGTLTLKGAISIPEAPEGRFWDTALTQTISPGAVVIQQLNTPYHYYRPEFEQQGSGAIEIYVVIEGIA